MKDRYFHRTPLGEVWGKQVDLSKMAAWQSATIAGVRDAILSRMTTAADLSGWAEFRGHPAVDHIPRQREVEAVAEAALRAVEAGRLFDFGYLPNKVIKAGGNRGGPLYTQSAIGHPFVEPWVGYHIWEDGAAVYLFQLMELDKPAGGITEAVELVPMMHDNTDRLLMIGDRSLLTPNPQSPHKYECAGSPSIFRFLKQAAAIEGNEDPYRGAAANVLDPMMTMLLILNTRGIERETIRADVKLNRARAKNKKPLIPPFDRVNTALYVTAVLNRGKRRERGDDLGGTHASPVTHLRQGHWREYSDHNTFVQDTLVNATPEARERFRAARSHYSVRS